MKNLSPTGYFPTKPQDIRIWSGKKEKKPLKNKLFPDQTNSFYCLVGNLKRKITKRDVFFPTK